MLIQWNRLHYIDVQYEHNASKIMQRKRSFDSKSPSLMHTILGNRKCTFYMYLNSSEFHLNKERHLHERIDAYHFLHINVSWYQTERKK